MHFGIFTFGTRGDVQPYIALALGLLERGHKVTLAAPKNFKPFVEGFALSFHPLEIDVEEGMSKPEGQRVLKTNNSIQLMKYIFKVLHECKVPLRKSYIEGVIKVDVIICNHGCMDVVASIAEKQNKRIAYSYFMPPLAKTGEFPAQDMDFFNFPFYNRLSYEIIYAFYWKFIKKHTNEFRRELGLPVLRENLIHYIQKQKNLDLYCISQHLIAQPKDWKPNQRITGFLTVPKENRECHEMDKIPEDLSVWLRSGRMPVYMGFGSNGVGDPEKVKQVIEDVIDKSNERILFCTGWATYPELPEHPNLFVTQYINHEVVIPQCKAAVFHGGAGTLATMLRHEVPVIVVSFYTDQPTWGKIIEKKKLGFHIPFKKLSSDKLLKAIRDIKNPEIKSSVSNMGRNIKREDGLKNAINALEIYFGIVA